jgi:ATP-binding cassette, subfamily C (CFTR/MRP), member 1
LGFKKALKIQSENLNVGSVVNMLTSEGSRLFEAIIYFHFSWVSILQIIIISFVLGFQIQYAILPGIVMLLIFLGAQVYSGSLVSKFREKAVKMTDERVGIMNEVKYPKPKQIGKNKPK